MPGSASSVCWQPALFRACSDPHAARVVWVEDEAGKSLGQATLLDPIANILRVRRKPEPAAPDLGARQGPNLVEIAHAQYHGRMVHEAILSRPHKHTSCGIRIPCDTLTPCLKSAKPPHTRTGSQVLEIAPQGAVLTFASAAFHSAIRAT